MGSRDRLLATLAIWVAFTIVLTPFLVRSDGAPVRNGASPTLVVAPFALAPRAIGVDRTDRDDIVGTVAIVAIIAAAAASATFAVWRQPRTK